jgi:glycerol-3-phosphate dehydrogenase
MASLTRNDTLDRLRSNETWDVVVIGGGATGLGAAVDAAARGHRTLLLEAHDFAQGTSSRSTKLIHGGLRYLAQGNVSLVREALHERGLLLRNAPHLVHPCEFIVPAYRWLELPYYRAGLKVYDWLAGRLNLGASHRIGAAEVIARIPTLSRRGLRGGIAYTDGQFDDARLAIALARTLSDLGAAALNYAPVTGFTRRAGRIAGVVARDSETGEEFTIAAHAVINATGVYVDSLRRLDDAGIATAPLLTPSQGTHVVIDRAFFPGASALMVPRTDDGRVLFTIPWRGRVLVGTTDTPVADIPIEPHPQREEIEYLLDHIARYITPAPSSRDVLSTFAGLRPLLRSAHRGVSTARLSREHAVEISKSGLITITGGKWTTYRRMGADAVDHAARVGDLAARPSATRDLKLHGWQAGLDASDGALSVYGSDRPLLEALAAERAEWSRPLNASFPYREAEVIWAVRHEAARSVEDILARRTRSLFLDARASMEAAPRVADLLAKELGRDAAWCERQVSSFRELARGYIVRAW